MAVLLISIPTPPMPAPVREVVAGGAVSNAIDWIVATFWQVVWSGVAFGSAVGVVAFLAAVGLGYLLGRVRK